MSKEYDMEYFSKMKLHAKTKKLKKVSFIHAKGSPMYWTWETTDELIEISKINIQEFINDTFYMILKFEVDSKDQIDIFTDYLMKWGCPFPSKNYEIKLTEVKFQARTLLRIENILFYINKNELIYPVSDLLEAWNGKITLKDCDIDHKYWVHFPHINTEAGSTGSGWVSTNKKRNTFLLVISKPSKSLLEEINKYPEERLNYFKQETLKNIEKYLKNNTFHSIKIDAYGSVLFNSHCNSLIAVYILNKLTTNFDPGVPQMCQCGCGKTLIGKQEFFASTACKNKYHNKTTKRKISNWVNRKVSLGHIDRHRYKTIMEEVSSYIEYNEMSEKEIREKISKDYFATN